MKEKGGDFDAKDSKTQVLDQGKNSPIDYHVLSSFRSHSIPWASFLLKGSDSDFLFERCKSHSDSRSSDDSGSPEYPLHLDEGSE